MDVASISRFIISSVAFRSNTSESGSDEVALFNSNGKAVAYIALADGLTIYLWSGKPVAYLSSDNGSSFHVYGFNGKHIGWFVDGIVRDHDGNGACAVKERMSSTEFEPFKGFKEFKPFKSFKRGFLADPRVD
jgi:hypothetical protein